LGGGRHDWSPGTGGAWTTLWLGRLEKEVGVTTRLWQAVLADPHPVWLDAIAQMLEASEFEVMARSSPGPDALAVLEEIHPDILITGLDDGNGGLDGPTYIREARARSPETKIFVLAADAEIRMVHDVLLAGASAYVVKTTPAEDLLAAVRQMIDASVFMVPPELLGDLPAPSRDGSVHDAKLDQLTRREKEILRLAAEGLTNAQLARMLWLSEQTVKFHLSNIYRKLGVGNRTEASRWAQMHGALGDQDDAGERAEREVLLGRKA